MNESGNFLIIIFLTCTCYLNNMPHVVWFCDQSNFRFEQVLMFYTVQSHFMQISIMQI